jgi:hypothetical protein
MEGMKTRKAFYTKGSQKSGWRLGEFNIRRGTYPDRSRLNQIEVIHTAEGSCIGTQQKPKVQVDQLRELDG